MTTVNRLSAVELANLDHDGATVGLPDGTSIRLRLEPDQDHGILDEAGPGTWAGLLEWTRGSRDYMGAYNTRRPEGFNGLARVIERGDHGERLWWQPPGPDIIGPTPWDAETMRQEEERIRDLYRYGFVRVFLEVIDGTDAYGQEIVRDYNVLWGVEWDADGAYLASIAADLVGEFEGIEVPA